MTFQDILKLYRDTSFTEKEKGTRFERLMCSWLKTDPRYSTRFSEIWLWEDFPSRKDLGGNDTGIDIVARTNEGDYWAIQCKCYSEDAYIDKPAVDSFLATSSRTFTDDYTFKTTSFAQRLWISTTNKWGSNADEAIHNQNPPVSRINLNDLNESPVDWQKLLDGIEGVEATSDKKHAMEHQLKAVDSADAYYKDHDRGKMIMACGTGKTYTSLLVAEKLLNNKGLVLFMVPSIALLGQSLNAWAFDSEKPIKAVCICSDAKASRKINKDADISSDSVVDLAVPASTNARSIANQLLTYRHHDGLVVVFSTYQSIDAVTEAQKELLKQTNNSYGIFDFIICDEAHRTTGVTLKDSEESNFVKIHSNDNVIGNKRLYMTATPRLYGEGAKIKAYEKECILCSMDDKELYGEEFYRVNFSYAVEHGLLTDYKVLVLTMNEQDIPDEILKDVKDKNVTELNYDDTSKLIGVINGLSKNLQDDEGKTWNADPVMMKRAVAFCSCIGSDGKPGSSKNVTAVLPELSRRYSETDIGKQEEHLVSIDTRHIDGTMNSQERNEILQWLSNVPEDTNECRVVSNVRCLSEGVDVPSLDAVLFLSARNSQVDVVQSVGRVMRNFRKGQPNEKKYGYIIIPVVVPEGVKAEEALDKNGPFNVVWSILNSLRSHDDRFEAKVQAINLNKKKENKIDSNIIFSRGGSGIGKSDNKDDAQTQEDEKVFEQVEVAKQLELQFGEAQQAIYAKLVEKCGDRMYWENWSNEVGKVALKFIDRIERLIHTKEHEEEFAKYLEGLQKNINPSVDETQAIEMLAQHMITKPVFDALFAEYQFVNNNSVSRSMEKMINLLKDDAFEKDTEILTKFYESVKKNVGKIDNLEGKQTIIKTLYEKFFKGAFPKTVEKLGIVYTPVECVDFIIHSVDDILKSEFNTSLTEKNVHILDPFVGTGTFITRLLQSGLIKPEDMERKYREEIHCNEIVLLAYYIADVNIESVFHDLTKRQEYLPYDCICLTDTFQLAENHNDLFSEIFQTNSERVNKLKKTPVRVIIGNPPYSVGQKNANDNAQNLKYETLDNRISETYVKYTNATNKNSLYDSYIKAFRWASDTIPLNEGGVIAFISNGSWLDGNAQDGMRKCLEEEFSSIYVLNLRGNCRTSGEARRKEGDGIFGLGSRTPISITILVKNPKKDNNKATIYYYDIGDYLSREDKLKIIKDFNSIDNSKINWINIKPNNKYDWINQRDGIFDSLILIGDKGKTDEKTIFTSTYSRGFETARDAWIYNFSDTRLNENINYFISNYNAELNQKKHDSSGNYIHTTDSKLISWSSSLESTFKNNIEIHYKKEKNQDVIYRPFTKQRAYCGDYLIHRIGQWSKIGYLDNPNVDNLVICVPGIGNKKKFSALMVRSIADLGMLSASQCFPLYWYEESAEVGATLFDDLDIDYTRHDGITDWILKQIRSRFNNTHYLSKEHIFFYVYGILHSEQYKLTFENDLSKSLPRIPIVDTVEDFMAFYTAGKKLADLHLDYEDVAPCTDVAVKDTLAYTRQFTASPFEDDEMYAADASLDSNLNDYDYYAVNKMSFGKKQEDGKTVIDKSKIIYNSHITLENIPKKAYEYQVNGKSAIEWIIERYAVTIDKDSLIKNDPNDWSKEHNKPRYILDLLLSVINMSIQSVDIINNLPNLKFE